MIVKRFGKLLNKRTSSNFLDTYSFQCSYSFDSTGKNKIISAKKTNLSGIFPAISTPFDRSITKYVCYKSLEKNLTDWNLINFAGYAVNGFYGEYPYLSNEERFELIKVIRDIVGKKKKIIASSGSESVTKTIKHCELMAKCDADYLLIFTPYFYKKQMTHSALFNYFTKVADKSPLPIILHNIPSMTSIDMPVDLCLDLACHPNIVGLKECTNNIQKIARICEHVRKTNIDFSVFTGSASFMLDGLRVGASGSINAVSSFLGPLVVDLYEMFLIEEIQNHEFALNSEDEIKLFSEEEVKLFKVVKDQNKRYEMNMIQNRLIPPDMIISEYGVPGLKAALDLSGYYGGPCRLPLSDLNEEEITNLKMIIEHIKRVHVRKE